MTNPKNPSPDIGNQVMHQIKKQHITMRPKAYFILGSLLLGLGFAAAIITAIVFISILTHNFRTYAPHQYLQFGASGIRPFIFNFSWLPLLISIVGIAGGVSLLKKYDISYKKSFFGITASLVTAIILLAIFIDYLGLNNRLQQVRPMRNFYLRQFVDQDFTVGEIQAVEDHFLQVISPEGHTYDITWDETTMLPHGSDFQLGDIIQAVGDWESEATFSAKGIIEGPMHPPPAFSDPNIRREFNQRMHQHMHWQ